jgi:hypothetical protein
MSAFIVSKKHIDTLISSMGADKAIYWNDERISFHADKNRIGQELVNQNYRSVNERYQENDAPPVYKFQMQYPLPGIAIVKACDCYDYQASETEDYKETLACRIIDAIRYAAIRRIPGYDDAAWEIA